MNRRRKFVPTPPPWVNHEFMKFHESYPHVDTPYLRQNAIEQFIEWLRMPANTPEDQAYLLNALLDMTQVAFHELYENEKVAFLKQRELQRLNCDLEAQLCEMSERCNSVLNEIFSNVSLHVAEPASENISDHAESSITEGDNTTDHATSGDITKLTAGENTSVHDGTNMADFTVPTPNTKSPPPPLHDLGSEGMQKTGTDSVDCHVNDYIETGGSDTPDTDNNPVVDSSILSTPEFFVHTPYEYSEVEPSEYKIKRKRNRRKKNKTKLHNSSVQTDSATNTSGADVTLLSCAHTPQPQSVECLPTAPTPPPAPPHKLVELLLQVIHRMMT